MPITTLPTGSIVSYSGIGSYPPFTRDVINASWSAAATLANSYETKSDAIANTVTGVLTTEAPDHITAGTAAAPIVVEPNVSIPETIDTSTILATFDAETQSLLAELTTKYTGFLTTYFPEDVQTYTAAETWIQAAVANPNGGLPTAVAAQLLTDETDKITIEASRATDSVVSGFAARGFPLPPGMAASAAVAIQQTAQDKKAEAGRKLTAISIDMMKFAVEKALGLRQMAMGAAIEYCKTLTMAPEIASKVTGIGYDAQTKLIGAASAFLNARTEVKKLVSSVEQFNVSTQLQVAEKNQAADLTVLEDRLKALLTESQAIAQMSTALFNNLHASTSVSSSVSTNDSL